MFYVYILKSERDQNLYVGSTNDLRRRLAQHNAGTVRSTAQRRPFILPYYEAYRLEEDARRRESMLKKDGRALAILKQRIRASLQ
jgi:putative endonuclease